MSTKALLVNLLIFPGLGHGALGKWKRGAFFYVPATLGIILIIRQALHILNLVKEKGVPPTVEGMLPVVHEAVSDMDSNVIFVSMILIIVSWIAGVVDSLRLKS